MLPAARPLVIRQHDGWCCDWLIGRDRLVRGVWLLRATEWWHGWHCINRQPQRYSFAGNHRKRMRDDLHDPDMLGIKDMQIGTGLDRLLRRDLHSPNLMKRHLRVVGMMGIGGGYEIALDIEFAHVMKQCQIQQAVIHIGIRRHESMLAIERSV